MGRANLSHLTKEEKKDRRRLQQIERRKNNPAKEAEYNAKAAERKKRWAKDNEKKIKQGNAKLYQENRECRLEYAKSYREDNPEKIKESRKARYESNKEAINAKNKEWRDSKPREYHNEYLRKWKSENRGKVVQSGKKRSIPMSKCLKLLGGQQIGVLNQFYNYASRISECIGIKHHVDHVLPLAGDGFTGLHVPWNLQVIPATINLRKGNRS
jgi:hypothetical protein